MIVNDDPLQMVVNKEPSLKIVNEEMRREETLVLIIEYF